MKIETILITGGAGFVGSNLAMYFKVQRKVKNVIALDNLKRRGSELNVARLKEAGVIFIHGDVRSLADIESVGKFDLLIECSAEPSVMAGLNGSPDYLLQSNLVGAINCLEAARKNKAAFIFLSTSRVYPYQVLNNAKFQEDSTSFLFSDNQEITGLSVLGVSENFPLQGARSIYGATKLSAELLVAEYAASYGMKTIVNRFGCIAGPWQMGKTDQGVLALWVFQHLVQGKLSYIGYGGNGRQVRDFIHVDDVCEIIGLQVDEIAKVNGMTFNIGGGHKNAISLQELSILAQKFTGNKIDIASIAETRPVDLKCYITDNSHLYKVLHWQPQNSIERVVKDTAAWMKKEIEKIRPILGE